MGIKHTVYAPTHTALRIITWYNNHRNQTHTVLKLQPRNNSSRWWSLSAVCVWCPWLRRQQRYVRNRFHSETVLMLLHLCMYQNGYGFELTCFSDYCRTFG